VEPLATVHVLSPDDDPSVAFDAGAAALAEIDAAIALVLSAAARRVHLTALPFVESVAGTGLSRARAAGVGFAFERGERAGVATVTIGPRDPRPVGA
jgi:hypothetical protein